MSLAVRADDAGARELYAGLGFEEERVILPLRRAFSLGWRAYWAGMGPSPASARA